MYVFRYAVKLSKAAPRDLVCRKSIETLVNFNAREACENELVARGVDVQLEFLINASINSIADSARLLYAAF